MMKSDWFWPVMWLVDLLLALLLLWYMTRV